MIIKFYTENGRHEGIEIYRSSSQDVNGLEISIGDGESYGGHVFLSIASVERMMKAIKMLLKEEK